MPSFLYFVENPAKAVFTADDAKAAGLGHALRDKAGVACCHTHKGPGGLPGLVLSFDPDAQAVYQPQEQTWRRGARGVWAGCFAAARPGPADLRRPTMYEGSPVRLLDGNDWIVPRCHAVLPDRPSGLPYALDLGDDGQTLVTRVHPRYAALCESAFDFWMEWSCQKPQTMTADQRIQLALDALAVNYRIGRLEAIALLGLFGSDEWKNLLRVLIDADEIEAHLAAAAQKKSTSADGASSTSSGATASSLTTSPASPS